MTNEGEKMISGRNLLILILLLLTSGLSNLYFLLNRAKLTGERDKAMLMADSSLSVKLQVEKQLHEATVNLNSCVGSNKNLTVSVEKLNDDISQKQSLLEKIKTEINSVAFLKKQLKEAKRLRIESENLVNQVIREKEDLEKGISTLNKQIIEKNEENDKLKKKLEWAKDLKAYEISVMGYRANKNKQRPTIRAKKLTRFMATFTLAENKVIEPGTKNINIVISGPKTNILSNDNERFSDLTNGVEKGYSTKKVIDYRNEEQKITINYDTSEKLLKGKYLIEIYVEGKLSGKKELELR